MICLANPVISKIKDISVDNSEVASYVGVAVKTLLLIAVVFISAVVTWKMRYATPMTAIVTAIMGFLTVLAIVIKPLWADVLAPAYAILEGMFLASVSMLFAMKYPGIVFNALMLTFGIAISAAFIYAKGYVKVDSKFIKVVFLATIGIAVTYLLEFILSFFGIRFMPLHQNGIIGIGFSLFVVGVATLNLFVDYEHINQSVKEGLPKTYEWYCAFGLVVTLVWLYVEILSLLRKLR